MNETVYSWTFKFHKVVRQQNSGAVKDFILEYSAVYLRIQRWKNYWNRFTFAKVTVKIKVAQFFLTHSVLFPTKWCLAEFRRSRAQWRRQNGAREGARNWKKIIKGWYSKLLWKSYNKQWQSYIGLYIFHCKNFLKPFFENLFFLCSVTMHVEVNVRVRPMTTDL